MRRRRKTAGALGVLMTAVLALLIASPAFAHTEKDAGPYKLTFGWQHEPTYVGVENAVQVFVHDAKGNPLDDLGTKGLTVAVSTQGQTSPPLALTGAFDPDTGLGNHGEFDAAIVPTQPGTYTLHITGDINGTAVDVSAASSDSTFNDVADPTGVEFPAKTPTVQALAAAVTSLQDKLATVQSAANSAKSSTSGARTLALIAIVVAVALAVVARRIGGRRKAPSAP